MSEESTQIIFEHVSRFRHEIPNVPFAEGLDEADFKGEEFVTLPLMPIGAKSRNGYHYGEQAVRSVVSQINEKRPEGRWGHLKKEDRATHYEPAAVRWVGAIVDESGLAWGKAHLITEQAKRHFHAARSAKARVGTSLYGIADLNGQNVVGINLETIDIADPERVGIVQANAVPHIVTQEMQESEENLVSEQLIQELTQARDTANTRIAEMQTTIDTQTALIAELCGVVGVEKPEEIKGVVAEFITARNKAQETSRKAVAAKVIAEQLDKLPDTAALVAEFMGTPDTDDEDAIKGLVQELLQKPFIKPVAENERVSKGGPRAFTGQNAGDAIGKARVNDDTVNQSRALFGG